MSKSSGISSDSSYEAGMSCHVMNVMSYKDGVIIDPREAENRHLREAEIELDVPEEEEEADDKLNQAFIDPDKTITISEEERERRASERERVQRELAEAKKREAEINNLGWHGINNQQYTFLSKLDEFC